VDEQDLNAAMARCFAKVIKSIAHYGRPGYGRIREVERVWNGVGVPSCGLTTFAKLVLDRFFVLIVGAVARVTGRGPVQDSRCTCPGPTGGNCGPKILESTRQQQLC